MAETDSKTVKIPVTMTDGTVVEFAGKRKMVKSTTIDADNMTITTRFDFRNGEFRTFTLGADSPLLARFAAHGIEQKIGDEAAGTESVDDMVLDIEDVIDRLNKGEWNVRREGGGNQGASVLLQALVELYKDSPSPKSAEQIREFLKTKSQAEKVAMRANPKLKPIIDRIEAEKAAKSGAKVDTDALLAELG